MVWRKRVMVLFCLVVAFGFLAIIQFLTRTRGVIDDMERYQMERYNLDEEPLEIWAFWADGFDDPANGSLVGTTFFRNEAERNRAYEGKQSMPMFYDNTSAAVAEATRTFLPPLDLTISATDNIGIYFQGDAANGPAAVYLTVTDDGGQSVKVTHADPAATLLTDWTLLKVAVSDLGRLNVSTIRSITLGVEGAGATGTLFADYLHVSADDKTPGVKRK